MKAFFRKHKAAMLYWLILLLVLLYFVPGQRKYYLDQDIKQFKTVYLIPILVWAFGLLSVGLFVFWLIKTKSAKHSAIGFVFANLIFAFIILVFHNIFLGIILFANRHAPKEKVHRQYQASFVGGIDHSKNNFSLYDPSTKSVSSDIKLINELYHPGLKQNDTIGLMMYKGIFGIAFSPHPFNDK